MDDLTDHKLMRRTFALAKMAKNRGNGAFGALLAKNGVVLFEAENTVTEEDADLTCHAEMNLLREASAYYPKSDFESFTMYCSTEPCVMCAGAAYYCGLGRIVFGVSVEALESQTGEGLPLSCREVFAQVKDRKIEVVGPVLEDEALDLHRK